MVYVTGKRITYDVRVTEAARKCTTETPKKLSSITCCQVCRGLRGPAHRGTGRQGPQGLPEPVHTLVPTNFTHQLEMIEEVKGEDAKGANRGQGEADLEAELLVRGVRKRRDNTQLKIPKRRR
ncbi:hypothetical protein NE237_016569 [Protea cynaroides]|uniref:Uncharacterized protein n=1 Tax=Protea cynaroides TaxID=273540 RepID=A0A9Q0HHC4_9MAGN|nr:hypothetical protein NE237_016569 [Protea cynaroides]